jgi:hypothetical protein
MNIGLSDKIREMAREKYVSPALRAGKERLVIRVRDLLREGIPARNAPQICSSLQSAKFLRENRLEIEKVEGPPSKQSSTVVVRYRVAKAGQPAQSAKPSEEESAIVEQESPEARALRLTEKLRGLLKEELAEYGGAEAFIRWVRGYDEEDTA